ncbi:MAG: S8 family serine peptidase [Armatimonadetes bacterium]|nr:S8 family serine peptidase [Armatimonadota bacterium]
MKRISLSLLAVFCAAFSWAQGEIVAQLNVGVSAKELAHQFDISIKDQSPYYNFALFGVRADQNIEVIEEELRLSGLVVWVEDNEDLDSPEGGDNLPIDQGRTGGKIAAAYDTAALGEVNKGLFDQISYQQTPFLFGQRRINVAVLDTGLSPLQPRLWRNVRGTYNALDRWERFGYDVIENRDDNANGIFDEAVGHGTFVTGLIVGLAPHARIVNCKVANSEGVSSSWNILKGLTVARRYGCELVNISLGAPGRIFAMSEILDWADQNGMVIVAAAGNQAVNELMDPARNNKVVAVTAVDPHDVKADFSNYHARTDFAAPGTGIISTNHSGGMSEWSGTSFACPIACGVIADALRKRSPMTPEMLRDWLDGNGDDIDPLNPQYAGELGVRINWARLNLP